MTLPLLKLWFVKGPRDGEFFEYKPGSTITIGRVVRGNKIAVKDAGISTKHLRIVSDSENWIIQDLGSSNGTIVKFETLEPHTSVNLSHGDVIKLGEVTSIIVNFETGVQAEEHKLPPRPIRNTRRLPVADPVPIEDKPTHKGRSGKNEKKVAITKEEEEVPVEKRGNNSRVRGGKKNTEAAQNSGLNSIKLEIEDTPKGVEISRATRSRQIGNVKSEDTVLEEVRRPSRATRSMKKEIVGDSLEMVLSQARKTRANKKNMEQKQPSESVVAEMETKNDDVEEDKDVEAEKDRSETSERVEQVEIESRNLTFVGEDEETENLQDTVDEESYRKSLEVGVETSDGGGRNDEEKAEQESRNDKKADKIDLEKMTLGEWIEHMKVQIPKQIIDETEKIIDEMRSRSRRVHQYIAEQQAKGKGSAS